MLPNARRSMQVGRILALAVAAVALHTPCYAVVTSEDLRSAARAAEAGFPFAFRIRDLPQLDDKHIGYTRVDPAEYPDALLRLELLRREFAKYPKPFLRATGLQWVGIAKNLTLGGAPHTATHDMREKALVFDVRQAARNERYRRYVVHHEFFHFIEEHVRQLRGDPKWRALNPLDFEYRRNNGAGEAGTSWLYNYPRPGFVSTYSMSSEFEDRAEIHAALFDAAHYGLLMRIAGEDAIVRRKVTYVLEFLRRIDPSLDAEYFRRMHESK